IAKGNEIIIEKLQEIPVVMRRRLIRRVLASVAGYGNANIKDINFDHIESILSLISKQSGKTIHLPHGLQAVREYGFIKFFEKSQKTEKLNFSRILKPYSPIYIEQCKKWFYLGKKEYYSTITDKNSDIKPCVVTLDYGKIEGVGGLVIRTRLPGDVLYFKKMGTKKIKDFFIDSKIPRKIREQAVFVACESRIVLMIDGFLSDFFSVDMNQNTTDTNIIFLYIWEDEDGN
ncbi:MAG: tRNA lysidine(34) synthetase TilS, partial [Defluviitaleaceae bacterium]|nr:tRNA lysidine(34) synthetase TilS [Defluviitaleaceae bacterium]